MRIVHCISSLSGGGAERQLSYIVPRLADKGIDVHIAYLTDGPSPPIYGAHPSIHMHRIIHRNNYDPFVIWRMVALFHEIRPHLVHTWIPQIDILGGIAACVCRLPWVIREANSANAHQGWKAVLRKLVARRVDYVLANSVGGRDYWNKNLPGTQCSLIHNGLPGHVFLPLSSIKRTSIIKNNIIFAGRLVNHKNIFLLLKAAKFLSSTLDFKLLICGTGPLSGQIREFIKQSKLDEQVELCGYVNQETLLRLLRESSLLVSPSLYEGCPNVVLEAMASGCPVVISDIPAHRDILDEKSAIFFNPNDHTELENAIRKVYSHPQESIKRALNAREIAENFRLDNTVNSYIKIYEKLISS